MFKIQLSPQAGNTNTQITIDGEVLTYNEVEYDFSTIQEGDVAEAEFPAMGTITRVNGDIELTLVFNYIPSMAELNQSTDLNDYMVTIGSGTVDLPIIPRVTMPVVEQPDILPEPEIEDPTIIQPEITDPITEEFDPNV